VVALSLVILHNVLIRKNNNLCAYDRGIYRECRPDPSNILNAKCRTLFIATNHAEHTYSTSNEARSLVVTINISSSKVNDFQVI